MFWLTWEALTASMVVGGKGVEGRAIIYYDCVRVVRRPICSDFFLFKIINSTPKIYIKKKIGKEHYIIHHSQMGGAFIFHKILFMLLYFTVIIIVKIFKNFNLIL